MVSKMLRSVLSWNHNSNNNQRSSNTKTSAPAATLPPITSLQDGTKSLPSDLVESSPSLTLSNEKLINESRCLEKISEVSCGAEDPNGGNSNDDDKKLAGANAEDPQENSTQQQVDYSQTSKLVFGKENVPAKNRNTKRRLSNFMGKIQKSIVPPTDGGGELKLVEGADQAAPAVNNHHSKTGRRRSSIWNLKMVGHLTGSSNHKDEDKFDDGRRNDDGDNDDDDDDDDALYSNHKNYNKCKFVLPEEERDIPTFLETKNCDPKLISETRRLLRDRFSKNPDNFYTHDYDRMLTDDWTVSRFLLRRRCDPKRTAKLMEECGRFRKQYKMSEVKLWEFPVEFHKAGGLFKYARDRVGNLTVYMRVKMYRRVPEISDVFKAFILCVLEEADLENGGRGVAVIFDLSGCGLQNVDLGFLSWLLSSFRNYCPKGVSYILVYNLPWILNATCKLAMTWMSANNRRSLRFVHGHEIENFIAPENLPDYLGGTCPIDYRKIPEGAKPAIEVCERLDMTPEQALKIRELFKQYIQD